MPSFSQVSRGIEALEEIARQLKIMNLRHGGCYEAADKLMEKSA